MGGIISSIEADSIADDLEWKVGDEVVSINGNTIRDVIDYQFNASEEDIVVEIKREKQTEFFEIEKDYNDSLGIDFKDELFDGIKTCGANCIFCFVEQLPKQLRKPLYRKDDDFRLSFLHGNFVTLANNTQEDLDRIVKQHLSPLYISVHVTDKSLREKLLGRKSPDILEQLKFLSRSGIKLNTQIVLCRGINDANYLEKSLSDLGSLFPSVESIAVVPVGLTAHRKNKTPIPALDKNYSSSIIETITNFQKSFKKAYGTRLVWAADEFYLSAGIKIPGAVVYEGFPQMENGIGLVRKFLDSANRYKSDKMQIASKSKHKISFITGKLAEPIIRDWAENVSNSTINIQVIGIENNLFGKSVTVAGLIAGNDVINQLKGFGLGELLVVPEICLRDGAFLDDVSLNDLKSKLNINVIAISINPSKAIKNIIQFINH